MSSSSLIASFADQNMTHVDLSLIGREQHVPDFFDQSLYLMKLFSSSCPSVKFGGTSY